MPRPRTPILSRDRIVDAALALLDETGGFTIPQLAKRLGVSMSSLYHHMTNRAEIVAGIRERLTASFPELDPRQPWRQEVRRWARGYREFMVAHPNLVPELAANPVVDEWTRRAYEELAAVLERAGLPPASILPAITALDSYVLGSAIDVSVLSDLWATSVERDGALGRAQRAVPWSADGIDTAFELGLTGLLLALEELLPPAADTDGVTG